MPRGNPSSFKEAYVWHIKAHCVPDVARVVMALDFLLGGSQNYDIIHHNEGLAAWNIYTPVDLPQPRDLIAELRKIGAVKEEPSQAAEKAETTGQADQPSTGQANQPSEKSQAEEKAEVTGQADQPSKKS